MKFNHGTAIVTGGAKGNGFGIAEALAESGIKVAVLNRHSPEEAVNRLKAKNKNVIGFTCDISDRTNVEKCVRKVFEAFGSIDILVNNAGVLLYKPFLEMTDEERDYQLDVNIKGTWNVTRSVIPYMLKNSYGRIITVSSVTGEYVADPEAIGYGTSKAALVGFGKCLAMEFVDKGITSNVICPGFIRTPMVESMAAAANPEDPEGELASYAKCIPAGRLGRPEDLGPLVVYLASEESAFMTGSAIVIDGGCILPETKTL
ncbi:MAG TPA: SDR family oxidoreductase [Candidatus Copromorpha excrementigallinarum]|uniref:SDR family oxidoreductase n=1 Tax=Candidatus Allocopromorpha excrementigallinarum TaxID=2840742 RepID=A0A9D1I3H8_9FIRM|nr:SDR family oxidoreductase [Candidatus Copromorpha excrementigallinarum]